MDNRKTRSQHTTSVVLISVVCCLLLGGSIYRFVLVSDVRTYHQSRILLDTIVDLTVASSNEHAARQAMAAAYNEMQRLENLLSKYRQESQIYAINQGAGNAVIQVADEVRALLQRSQQYSRQTDGLFDITIGPLIDLWGIGTEHERIPDETELQQILPYINYTAIELRNDQGISVKRPDVRLDLGGIAKGYSIDRAIEILEQQHITSALLNAGGDIRCIGSKPDGTPWRIGIKHPRKEGILGVVELRDTAVATSGDYERFFVHEGIRYHHLLDPRTGMPVRDCQSVTILAQTAEMADALATAVFIMGPRQGKQFIEEQEGIEGMIIRADGEVILSSGFSFQPQ